MQGVGGVLRRDLEIAHGRLVELLEEAAGAQVAASVPGISDATAGAPSASEACFWSKATIRCLLGFVDGMSYAMRMAVVDHAEDAGLTLSTQEVARLRAKKYDQLRDRVLGNQPARLSTKESFKLAFRYFPRLLGSDYTLDTGGEPWRAFERLVLVRNNFTHPRAPEHLSCHNATPALFPALGFVSTAFQDLIRELGSRMGRAFPRDVSPAAPFKERDTPLITIFTDEKTDLVRASGSRSLEYVGLMFKLLHEDTLHAMKLTSIREPIETEFSQFAFRTYARTTSSEIEGTISACSFFLEAGAKRGEVTLSDAERQSMTRGEVEDKLVAALNLWSREYGNNYLVPRLGKNWKELRGVRFFRNRITHPKREDSLTVDLQMMETLIKGHSFLIEHIEATHLNEEKWMRVGPSLQAVEEAAALGSPTEEEGDEESL